VKECRGRTNLNSPSPTYTLSHTHMLFLSLSLSLSLARSLSRSLSVSQSLYLTCKGCGGRTDLNSADRFVKYMILHPPTDVNYGHAKSAAGSVRRMSHVTYMYAACHTYESGMSHISIPLRMSTMDVPNLPLAR